jgi:hypothetical protein
MLLIDICGDRIGPIVPQVIDLVCEGWGAGDVPEYITAVKLIAEKTPALFAPHVQRVTELIIENFPIGADGALAVARIFPLFRQLIPQVDHLIVPHLLNRTLQLSATDGKKGIELLNILGQVLRYADIEKYCVIILRALVSMDSSTLGFDAAVSTMVFLLFARLREGFLRFLPSVREISHCFSENLNMSIVCVANGFGVPSKILERYTGASDPPAQPVTRSRSATAGGIAPRISRTSTAPAPAGAFPAPEHPWEAWFEVLVTNCLVDPGLPAAIRHCAALGESYFPVRKVLFPLACAVALGCNGQFDIPRTVLTNRNMPHGVVRGFLGLVEILEATGLDVPIEPKVVA